MLMNVRKKVLVSVMAAAARTLGEVMIVNVKAIFSISRNKIFVLVRNSNLNCYKRFDIIVHSPRL